MNVHLYRALTRLALTTALVAGACFAAAAIEASAASALTLTEIPPGAGEHGYAYDAVPPTPIIPGAPFINLAEKGYTEREFLMSGTTNVYEQAGNENEFFNFFGNRSWNSSGLWKVSVARSGVPYKTRLLVRYPTNPAKFNGTVIVEWLNDTTGGDQDPVWAETYNELLNQGYAYAAVTAQVSGTKDLREWDPKRYGALTESTDGQSYDIFTQAGEAVKNDSTTTLGGLHPTTVVGSGDSQSAFRVDTYVNAIQPRTHEFNGFLAVGRYGGAAPIGGGLISLMPFPAYIRTNNTAPFVQLNTEGDVEELGTGYARQADSNVLRTWELAGGSHIDLHEAAYELATIAREKPNLEAPHCAFGVVLEGLHLADNMPLFRVEQAAVADLHRWITTGTQPPHGNPITTAFLFPSIILRDQYGNAFGGVRLPEINAPTETYSAINVSEETPELSATTFLSLLEGLTNESAELPPSFRNEGLCLLSGFFTPFSESRLRALYPTHASYVSKYKTSAASDLSVGFLTAETYEEAVKEAEASSIP